MEALRKVSLCLIPSVFREAGLCILFFAVLYTNPWGIQKIWEKGELNHKKEVVTETDSQSRLNLSKYWFFSVYIMVIQEINTISVFHM